LKNALNQPERGETSVEKLLATAHSGLYIQQHKTQVHITFLVSEHSGMTFECQRAYKQSFMVNQSDAHCIHSAVVFFYNGIEKT
jgi:hypothetical protein